MASKESNIANSFRIAAAKVGMTLFKNTRGMFRTIDGSRIVKAGLLADGASDLIGFKRIKVTPSMVGMELAIFCAAEVKTATGAVRPEQKSFIEFIRSSGGIGAVVRCDEDIQKMEL